MKNNNNPGASYHESTGDGSADDKNKQLAASYDDDKLEFKTDSSYILLGGSKSSVVNATGRFITGDITSSVKADLSKNN